MAARFEPAELKTLQDDVGELVRLLGCLRWRLGLERILVFVVRGVIASTLALIGLMLAAWLMPISNWPDLVWIVALPLAGALSVAVLRWPSDRHAALAADRRLALEERLGTAVELAGRFRTASGVRGRFDHLQVRDAVARARAAPGAWLALDRTVRREARVAAGLSVLAALSLVLPGLPRPGLPASDRAAAMTDALPTTTASDPAMLPLPDLTLVDTQPIPQAQSDADLASRVQQEQAERDALDGLAQAMGRISAGQPAADAIQRGDFPAARDQLSTLGEEADQLSDAAKQQLSRALQQAANATAATDRQLADRERQAAQTLNRGTYADQRQALRNLADQVEKSGARTTSADQLAHDVGRLQQQALGSQAQGTQSHSPETKGQAAGTGAEGSQSVDSQQASVNGGQSGSGADGQQGGPGVGSGSNPDIFGDQQSRLDTAGQRVEVPAKLGAGPGVRPPDGTEDQTGASPAVPPRSVSELVQSQRTGQVAPEQNLVPGEQRPVVRGYFR